MAAAQDSDLGQLRPADTNAASIYTPTFTKGAIIRSIFICNTSGASAKFRIFYDADGTTYDESTAIFWDNTIPADTTVLIENEDGIVRMENTTSNLAVRTNTASALTFTVFGEERS